MNSPKISRLPWKATSSPLMASSAGLFLPPSGIPRSLPFSLLWRRRPGVGESTRPSERTPLGGKGVFRPGLSKLQEAAAPVVPCTWHPAKQAVGGDDTQCPSGPAEPHPGQIRRLEREVDTAHPELPLSQRGGNWDFPQPLCTQNVNSTSVIHTQFNRWAHRMYSEITVYWNLRDADRVRRCLKTTTG